MKSHFQAERPLVLFVSPILYVITPLNALVEVVEAKINAVPNDRLHTVGSALAAQVLALCRWHN